jgi:hypothetical protein
VAEDEADELAGGEDRFRHNEILANQGFHSTRTARIWPKKHQCCIVCV